MAAELSVEQLISELRDKAATQEPALSKLLGRAALALETVDTSRIAFLLENHRKVVVERLPYGNQERTVLYVEEGFLGDTRYPEVQFTGEWASDRAAQLSAKLGAIDVAIEAHAAQAQQQEGA